MRILVTGSNGFVGRHFCAFLRQRGDEVVEVRGPHEGTGRPVGLVVDITDPAGVRQAVAEASPDGIVHLAGVSSVARSHREPSAAFAVNALGAVHLLEAVRQHRPECRVLLVGSGEMYGAVTPGSRAAEDHPLCPLSPYAAAKVAAEVAGFQYQRSYGVQVVSARPFNHLGPGQDPSFVVPSFARQIQAIQAGKAEPVLRTGDLSPVRDFSHVMDVVAGYRLLLEKGEPGTAYNLCSGNALSIRGVLDELLSLAGISARVEMDPSKLRPSELPHLVGDPSRAEALGWKREKTHRDALREALDEAQSPAS